LAQRSSTATGCWIAVGLLAALVAVDHHGLDTIAWLTLAVTTVMAAVMAAVALGQRHPDRVRVPGTAPARDPGPARATAGGAGVPERDGAAVDPRPVRAVPGVPSAPERDGAAVDLTLVVPVLGPADQLRATVEAVVAALAPTGTRFEVVAVTDAAPDGAAGAAGRALAGMAPQVRAVVLPEAGDRAAALRAGLAAGRGRYLGLLDGRGDLPPEQVAAMATLTRDGPDVVVGSRRHPWSEVASRPLRRIGSALWRLAVRALFRLPVRATRTGVTLVRRDVLADVLPCLVAGRDGFDLELLVVARRLGHRRVAEAPVPAQRPAARAVPWRAVAAMGRDLFALYYRLRVLHSYDGRRPPAEEVSAPAAEEAVV
jgi:hypothetical protein